MSNTTLTPERTLIEKRQESILQPPSLYRVVFLNDDITTFEFVMAELMGYYGKDDDQAFAITSDIHFEGEGIVGIYPRDIAETRLHQTISRARQEGYPLQVILQADDLPEGQP